MVNSKHGISVLITTTKISIVLHVYMCMMSVLPSTLKMLVLQYLQEAV